MREIDEQYGITLTYEEFEEMVGRICTEISLSDWRPEYVVALARFPESMMAGIMIANYLGVDFDVYDDQIMHDDEYHNSMMDIAFGYDPYSEKYDPENNKTNLLIVEFARWDNEDIGDMTQQWMNRTGSNGNSEKIWNEHIWNKSVRFAALFENTNPEFRKSYKGATSIDYSGTKFFHDEYKEEFYIRSPFLKWWTK